jgi:hypothetical protein
MKLSDIDINKIKKDIERSRVFSLSKGVLGAILCCYLANDEEFSTEWREKQLQRIIDNIWSIKKLTNIEYGLSGIGAGIQYLLEKGYVDGDPDDVLSEIDTFLFRKCSLGINQTDNNISVLLYLFIRLKYGLKEEKNRYLFIELCKDLINKIYKDEQNDLFCEPLPFSINYSLACYLYATCLFYDMDVYKNRIIKIWNEIINKVITIHPYLDANKLYMSVVANEVYKRSSLSKWKDYHNCLLNNISITRIINNEFGDQQVLFKCGLAGFSLILLKLSSNNINMDNHLENIIERMNNSSIWQEYKEDIYGLDGYMGVRFVRSILNKKLEDKFYT